MHEFLVGKVESDGYKEGEDEQADQHPLPGEGACSTAQRSRALGPLQDVFSIPGHHIQLLNSNRYVKVKRKRDKEREPSSCPLVPLPEASSNPRRHI